MKNKNHTQKSLLFIAHAYQPPRNFLKLSEIVNQWGDEVRSSILSGVNERVYQECYKPILIDSKQIPQGMIFSLYGTLREWIKEYHPQDFKKIKQKINKLKHKEYYLLCDSYVHPILPLMSEQDQDLLIKLGKKAFKEDFGFIPKGFWLPELAVSNMTLKVLYQNGFKFLVLRDDQLKKTTNNPMTIEIKENDKTIGEISVIHFNKKLSEKVWFENEATIVAEKFLQKLSGRKHYAIGTDMEVYGHLLSYKDQFITYITKSRVLSKQNFTHFDLQKALNQKQKSKTTIKRFSSWSCPHGIKRWTGECLCDTTDKKILNRIKTLFNLTQTYTDSINQQLDKIDPFWRKKFIDFFIQTKKAVFECGSLNREVQRLMQQKQYFYLKNPQRTKLFKAKTAALIAQTSCFAFFRDSDDRPEREIAQINLEQIKNLLSEQSDKQQPFINSLTS